MIVKDMHAFMIKTFELVKVNKTHPDVFRKFTPDEVKRMIDRNLRFELKQGEGVEEISKVDLINLFKALGVFKGRSVVRSRGPLSGGFPVVLEVRGQGNKKRDAIYWRPKK